MCCLWFVDSCCLQFVDCCLWLLFVVVWAVCCGLTVVRCLSLVASGLNIEACCRVLLLAVLCCFRFFPARCVLFALCCLLCVMYC